MKEHPPFQIPLIGLGTWKLRGEECEMTVRSALELGYRHVDTADLYYNHMDIARAIESYPREQLFITSKLYIHDLLPDRVNAAVPRFLDELKVDYLDLLLIHWPDPNVRMEETLVAMQAFQTQKMVRFIGVSNFVRSHLEALHQFPLAVNQIEMHPYLQRKTLVAFCQQKGIALTAYRPLAKGALESNETLQKIGVKYGKTPSQIALKWLVQQGISVIPKASSLKHLKDNLAIFDFILDEQDRQEIDQLDRGQRFCAPDGLPVYEDES